MRQWLTVLLALPCLAAASSTESVIPGWKSLTDATRTCQVSVPADWHRNPLVTRPMYSPDHRASVVLSRTPQGRSWKQTSAAVRQLLKPATIMEDSPERIWCSYHADALDLGANHTSSWYVAVPGHGNVCTAQIDFKDPRLEGTARLVAMSLRPVR